MLRACTAARPRHPKGHLQFMPARTGSTSRFATPLSARLPSHAFPVGALTWDAARRRRVRVHIMHVRKKPELCLNHRHTIKEASAISSHVTIPTSIRYRAIAFLTYYYTHSPPASLQSKGLLLLNLAGFPNPAKRRCKHANASKAAQATSEDGNHTQPANLLPNLA